MKTELLALDIFNKVKGNLNVIANIIIAKFNPACVVFDLRRINTDNHLQAMLTNC
jgi:hypothetical protein